LERWQPAIDELVTGMVAAMVRVRRCEVVSQLAALLLSLAQLLDHYARLRDDPALIPSATEEQLRLVSPIQGYYCTALTD
jgi:beta-dihydromenaquinone-9 omega-hydroxylase